MKNKDRKLRRKGNNVNNAQKPGNKQLQALSMNDKILLGKFEDLKTAMGRMSGDINEQVARIDRETNEFFQQAYNPTIKDINDKFYTHLCNISDLIFQNDPNLDDISKELKTIMDYSNEIMKLKAVLLQELVTMGEIERLEDPLI